MGLIPFPELNFIFGDTKRFQSNFAQNCYYHFPDDSNQDFIQLNFACCVSVLLWHSKIKSHKTLSKVLHLYNVKVNWQ